ncbi:hypothetical protein GCM10008955_19410 [Deinococcus malanensis]|uniref:Uncharacterized protein n=2 Tax=Deinococcus malanensis TaxID=1706855 RepID=A0ABQ2EXL2_9DEIO|nr:hypothetical protein GCM10008955_19410 [Deinococcus malanensis]
MQTQLFAQSCTSCGATPAMPHRSSHELLCTKCFGDSIRLDAAHDHLEVLMREAMKPWVMHWASQLLVDELADVMESVFEELNGGGKSRHQQFVEGLFTEAH